MSMVDNARFQGQAGLMALASNVNNFLLVVAIARTHEIFDRIPKIARSI